MNARISQSAAEPRPASFTARRSNWLMLTVIAGWMLALSPLLFWGLPSTRHDDLLFGGASPWKAERYKIDEDLRRLRERQAGADTDLNPVSDRSRVVDLTPDDTARAEILRRYRLFSRQPDEMITFRALQRMNPRHGDFDPQLYQYGGGYIYLIGAALASSAALKLVNVTSDAGYYLEHPEAFARFYVVARAVSLVFGALALIAVQRLARRAGGRRAGWIALATVALSPVFITGVLEAKPHLPSACLMLWAVLSALDYQAHGRWRDAVRMGLQAGYAFGLVLTGSVSALLWPALWLAARRGTRGRVARQLAVAGGLALLVYALTNPYAPYNWLTGRTALGSNITNSTAMYRDQIRHAGEGALRTAQLLVEGAGPLLPLVGVLGCLMLWRRHTKPTALAAALGLGVVALCVVLGAHKPAEFARFLVLPSMLLAVAAAAVLARLIRRRAAMGVGATLVVLGLLGTGPYVRSFAVDARGVAESRARAGYYLASQMQSADELAVLQEPAPYAVPPLDFARRRVFLLPAAQPAELDPTKLPAWLVFTADDDSTHAADWWKTDYALAARFPAAVTGLSRITWADKPVFVYRRAQDAKR